MQRLNVSLNHIGLKAKPRNYAKCITSLDLTHRYQYCYINKISPVKDINNTNTTGNINSTSKRHTHVHITRDYNNRAGIDNDRFLLSHDSIGLDELKAGKRTKLLVLIHGILGSKRNWRTVMKSFSVKDPELAVLAVDLRGHGDSGLNYSLQAAGTGIGSGATTGSGSVHPSFHIHTVENCAYDIIHLLSQLDIPTTTDIRLCAHSFGGKVALRYLEICQGYRSNSATIMSGALKQPSPVSMDYDVALTPSIRTMLQPSHVWIVDSIPAPHSHNLHSYDKNNMDSGSNTTSNPTSNPSAYSTVDTVIHALLSLPAVFPSKQYVLDELTSPPHNISMAIAQWIATSIVDAEVEAGSSAKPSCRFMFDIRHIVELYIDYCKTDMFPFLHDYSTDAYHNGIGGGVGGEAKTKIQFICAGKNNAWTQSLPGSPDTDDDAVSDADLELLLDTYRAGSGTSSGAVATPLQFLEAIESQSPSIAVRHMSHVGHWVHSEDPKGFISLVLEHSD